MRRAIIVCALLAVALGAYLAWPAYTLTRLARAVEARDLATIVAHVNVPSLHRSLADQVLETYLKLTGKTVSPLAGGVLASAFGNIADPLVAKIVAPEPLADFLRNGWPTAVLPGAPPGTSGLTSANLGSAWKIYRASRYGIRRFEIELPQTLPPERRFGLEFQISNWRWRLTAMKMPDHLRVRLAELLIQLLGGKR